MLHSGSTETVAWKPKWESSEPGQGIFLVTVQEQAQNRTVRQTPGPRVNVKLLGGRYAIHAAGG